MGYCVSCGGWDRDQGGTGHRLGCRVADPGSRIEQPIVEAAFHRRKWWMFKCSFDPTNQTRLPVYQPHTIIDLIKKGAPEGRIIEINEDTSGPSPFPHLVVVGPLRHDSVEDFAMAFHVRSGAQLAPEILSTVEYDYSFDKDLTSVFRKRFL